MWSLFLLVLTLACSHSRYKVNKYPRRKAGKPLILAHRGASEYAPENTLAAMKEAMKRGADGVEFDVCMSKDGIPVIIHDDTVDRTTNGQGNVWDFTAQQLAELDATMGFDIPKEGVPTLVDTLNILPTNFIVNVELKSNGKVEKETYVKRVLLELEPHNERLQIILSSFDWEMLHIARKLNAPQAVAVLVNRTNFKPLQFNTLKPDALHLHHGYAPEKIGQFIAHQLPVSLWTVDEQAIVDNWEQAKVAAIFTNKLFPQSSDRKLP